MRSISAAAPLLSCLLALLLGPPARAQERPLVGAEAICRLDLLPRFRQVVKVGCVSSYDRSGGNDDGFSGKHSFVRKEGDGLVLADLKGPGVITRIWTPTPSDDPVEFFFDGEEKPRLALKFRELFTSVRAPFLSPLSSYGAGGFWSYVPLPYRSSCKVVMRAARVQFYQLNFATYADGTGLASFDPTNTASWQPAVEKAGQLLDAAGSDVTRWSAPEGSTPLTTRVARTLAPGQAATLFESDRGGRVLGLRLSPAAALGGKDRAILLRMTWDGETAVLAPVADLLGFAWGGPAARSLLFGTTEETAYLYLPMPFDRSAKIELVSEREGGPPIDVQAEVVHVDVPRRADEGRLYAVWRREDPTTVGQPFTFVDTPGRGHLVGVTLQAQGKKPGETPFFEGDDEATIDGELAIHGTGSEDFFNGGWYDVPGRWESRVSFPLTGCLEYKKPLARTGAYRLFLADAYDFRKSLRLTIEHWGEGNKEPDDYVGVSYLYAESRPTGAGSLAPVAERRVRDPERLVYTPGWSVPIHSFSFERATVTKKRERIDGKEVRYLSLQAEGEDVFGPHYVSFLCEVPAAGRYRVAIEALTGPDEGKVQLFQNERAAGEPLDLYAAERKQSGPLPAGTLTLQEGPNQVFFKLVGKNPQSTALRLDLVRIQLEKE